MDGILQDVLILDSEISVVGDGLIEATDEMRWLVVKNGTSGLEEPRGVSLKEGETEKDAI